MCHTKSEMETIPMAMNLKMTGVTGFVNPGELDKMAVMMNAAN